MKRTDLTDTPEWPHKLLTDHYRDMTPTEKIRILLALQMPRETPSE